LKVLWPFANWMREALTQNVGLKAIALVFSLGLFGYIHSRENVQQRTISVSVVTLPPESGARELMTRIPPDIHVTLRGSGRAITDLAQQGSPPVELDLRTTYPEEVKFTREMLRLPPQLELIVVDPPRLQLEWEEVITRQIPLQTSITGHVADGFIVKGEPVVEPERIAVRGPRSLVEVMQFARLASYNVTGLTEGIFPRRIAIDPPPDRVDFLGSPAATVTVEVKRRESEKLFSDVQVQVIGPNRASVVPERVDVTVIGPPDVVRELRAEQVVPQADLTEDNKWDPDTDEPGSATVFLKVPLNKVRVEVQPPTVTVKWR
jgi:YbbR domain-containing protein